MLLNCLENYSREDDDKRQSDQTSDSLFTTLALSKCDLEILVNIQPIVFLGSGPGAADDP